MAVLRVAWPSPEPLPLVAAAYFHANVLDNVFEKLGHGARHLTLVFPPADHTHRAWQLAAIQGLARAVAPVRVNAVVSDCEAAIESAVTYLQSAEGVTGQLLQLDDTGAAEVVSLPA